MKTRKPVVAGKFYPSSPNELKALIESIYLKEKANINTDLTKKTIIGGVVPHAGYIFSGYQAVHYFDIIKNSDDKIDTFIIINPNHTGLGSDICLDPNDFWKTPFGNVEIDKEFSTLLNIKTSEDAHKHEHSAEVILPFLQYFYPHKFKIVPITLSIQTPEKALFLAEQIFKAKNKLNRKINIIASSDFSHYVTPTEGYEKDNFILSAIENLDSKTMYADVKKYQISACGYGTIMALIEYSKMLGLPIKSNILKRGHSGDIYASNEVVDYISILFYSE